MHTRRAISVLGVFALLVILLTKISLISTLHMPASAQETVGIGQIIKQMSQQVANSNPGTDLVHIQQLLIQLAQQTAAQTNKFKAMQTITEIQSQITSSPTGQVSQALLHIAEQQTASKMANVIQVIKQVAQLIGRGIPGATALVQIASYIEEAETPLIKERIDKAAHKIAVETGGDETQIGETATALCDLGGNCQDVIQG